MSIQNVNVARFARNVEGDLFCDFQTPWVRGGQLELRFSEKEKVLLQLLQSNCIRKVFLFFAKWNNMRKCIKEHYINQRIFCVSQWLKIMKKKSHF